MEFRGRGMAAGLVIVRERSPCREEEHAAGAGLAWSPCRRWGEEDVRTIFCGIFVMPDRIIRAPRSSGGRGMKVSYASNLLPYDVEYRMN